MTIKKRPSITYFHRNLRAGYSINKVTQTIVSTIEDKEEFYVPCYRCYGIIKNLWYVFRRRNKQGINHVTGDIHYCILALIGCKSVLTIHDTVSLDFNKGSWMSKKITEWLWYRIPLKLASKVVCISEETRRSVSRYTNRQDIEVIYNAIDPMFKTLLKNQINNPCKVLIIGTNNNKNVERTIQALQYLDCEITIVGKISELQNRLLAKLRINYINKVGLTDEEVVDEYLNCDIVSFVSLYEGFGMPIIEANQVGRPVLCSNIPVLKEVAGKSAVFVDPYCVNEIHQGFAKLFDDSKLRELCVRNGLENVRRFSSTDIRSNWMDLYSSLL